MHDPSLQLSGSSYGVHVLPCCALRCDWWLLRALLQIIAAIRAAGRSVDTIPRISKLSAGFCNWVYRVEVVPAGTQAGDKEEQEQCTKAPEGAMGTEAYVVKIFSDMAKIRLAPEHRGVVDRLASEVNLSPKVLLTTPDLVVHEWFNGTTLTEDIVAEDPVLQMSIALQLGRLHASVTPLVFNSSDPILWSSIEKMLGHIAKRPERIPEPFTLNMVVDEVAAVRRKLEALPLGIVTGHGDFKPSNIMVDPGALSSTPQGQGGRPAPAPFTYDDVLFIDFELAGPNYRGFDLFKLFRRGQPTPPASAPAAAAASADGDEEAKLHVNVTEAAEAAAAGAHDDASIDEERLRRFLDTYLDAYNDMRGHEGERDTAIPVAGRRDDSLASLVAETHLFEPLTWLEAAIFFLFAIQEVRAVTSPTS